MDFHEISKDDDVYALVGAARMIRACLVVSVWGCDVEGFDCQNDDLYP